MPFPGAAIARAVRINSSAYLVGKLLPKGTVKEAMTVCVIDLNWEMGEGGGEGRNNMGCQVAEVHWSQRGGGGGRLVNRLGGAEPTRPTRPQGARAGVFF